MVNTPTNGFRDEIFVCHCNSTEHQIVFNYDKEDNLVYCNIHLTGGSFWQRLKGGLKYIFGYRSKYGDWDEFIWKAEHAGKLQQLADTLRKKI